MATAKCLRCDATATADTFEQARKLLNHAIGLGRGIKCGDNYNSVVEVDVKQTKQETPTETKIAETETLSKKTVKEKKTKTKEKQKFTTPKI